MNQYKSKKLLGSTPNYNAKKICLDTVSYYKEDEILIDKIYQDFVYDGYLGNGHVKFFSKALVKMQSLTKICSIERRKNK